MGELQWPHKGLHDMQKVAETLVPNATVGGNLKYPEHYNSQCEGSWSDAPPFWG